MDLRVECGPGPHGPAVPGAIWFGARRVEVLEVLDRWHGPAHTWWKVATAEGQYVLRFDAGSSTWDLAAVVRD